MRRRELLAASVTFGLCGCLLSDERIRIEEIKLQNLDTNPHDVVVDVHSNDELVYTESIALDAAKVRDGKLRAHVRVLEPPLSSGDFKIVAKANESNVVWETHELPDESSIYVEIEIERDGTLVIEFANSGGRST